MRLKMLVMNFTNNRIENVYESPCRLWEKIEEKKLRPNPTIFGAVSPGSSVGECFSPRSIVWTPIGQMQRTCAFRGGGLVTEGNRLFMKLYHIHRPPLIPIEVKVLVVNWLEMFRNS